MERKSWRRWFLSNSPSCFVTKVPFRFCNLEIFQNLPPPSFVLHIVVQFKVSKMWENKIIPDVSFFIFQCFYQIVLPKRKKALLGLLLLLFVFILNLDNHVNVEHVVFLDWSVKLFVLPYRRGNIETAEVKLF